MVETTRKGVEGDDVRDPLCSPARVPLVGGCPGPLALSAGPDTARWPASKPSPVGVGGNGWRALSTLRNLQSVSTCRSSFPHSTFI